MWGQTSALQILSCVYCGFDCDWELGKRQGIQMYEHLTKKHPEVWTQYDEDEYQEWLVS